MLKKILLLILLFSTTLVKAQVIVNVEWKDSKQSINSDTIYYNSNRKLSWPDFKGKSDRGSWAAAITQSGFGYQLAMTTYGSRTIINLSVYCYFNKNKSWVKKGADNEYALLHEQHHFDITYINTCLFIQKLKQANFTRANCNTLSAKIHDECFDALNKMQDEYDGETSNGRRKDVQAYWNKKIDEQLSNLITD